MTLPIAELRPAGLSPARPFGTVAIVCALATVTLQICYPLVHESTRDRVTAAVVVIFAVAVAMHAAGSMGAARGLCAVALSGGIGFSAEILGVHAGIPFGSYGYAASLGPRLAGVPIIVGLAWAMMAWPSAVVARRLARTRAAQVAIGPGPSRRGTSSSIRRWSRPATGPGGNPRLTSPACRRFP